MAKGEKSSEGKLYADEFRDLASDDDDEPSEGNEAREAHMVESIESYLAENPEVDEVVVFVGSAHLESVIQALDERIENASFSIANDNIVSDYLDAKRTAERTQELRD